jgi:hypothetical protein
MKTTMTKSNFHSLNIYHIYIFFTLHIYDIEFFKEIFARIIQFIPNYLVQ